MYILLRHSNPGDIRCFFLVSLGHVFHSHFTLHFDVCVDGARSNSRWRHGWREVLLVSGLGTPEGRSGERLYNEKKGEKQKKTKKQKLTKPINGWL